MTFTQDDLTAIKKAIASGTMRVKYQDKEVEYRSLNELTAIKNQIEGELSSTTSDDPLRRMMGVYDKGI